jgi:EAL domain-containing protein (putative c-di-GMP-specific phosphodiesterase class I)
VQGYVIAKPMPAEDLAPWLSAHRDSQRKAIRIGVRAP